MIKECINVGDKRGKKNWLMVISLLITTYFFNTSAEKALFIFGGFNRDY